MRLKREILDLEKWEFMSWIFGLPILLTKKILGSLKMKIGAEKNEPKILKQMNLKFC